ncbi:MAG: CDP-alcohol phosphatidyltransferase family protein [Chlamydiales bacterium]|nr:CDP-alcohol phosphatidyltransferase family protein [Chlamydiales bacterium]
MIEANFRKIYQSVCVDPLLRFKIIYKLPPNLLTCLSTLFGLSVTPLLFFGLYIEAFIFMIFSGFLDTLDGSLARYLKISSSKGAVLDIVSDRLVEFAILLGLYSIDPHSRALPTIVMLGSILICVSSFLVVGIFTENKTQKGFFYSPGLIERAEAFIFFSIMILFPKSYLFLSYLFAFLVFVTAAIRIGQFLKKEKI